MVYIVCDVCIDGRRYGCCSECYVVSNECNEPTSCLVLGGEVMYFVFALGVCLVS